VLFDASCAVHVTAVVPKENVEPEGGVHTTVTQLPVVVGGGYVTTAVPAVTLSELAVTLDGQLMVRAVGVPVNCTVTVKLQLSPVAAVQVTGVFPTGKLEPDGGLQTTPPPPSELDPQLPEVVGVPYVTTAEQDVVVTGVTVGQFTVQAVVAETTVVDVDAELSA